jgi:hypothetical protein
MMSQKAVLLAAGLLLSVAVGAFAWWSLQGGLDPQGPAPQSNLDAAPSATPNASDLTAPIGDPPVAIEASAERAEVGSTGRSARPLPDDAEWVQVTVVDRDSDAPLPGAKVLWSDEKSWRSLVREDPSFYSTPTGQRCARLPEALAELAGWQTIADDQGRVRVTLRQNTTVVGMHDGRYGLLQLVTNSVPPPQGHRLRLQPDLALTVRVVDDRAEPCAGVALQVVPHDDKGQPLGDFQWSSHGETDADGLATIPHLQQLRQQLQQPAIEHQLGPGQLPPLVWRVRARTAVSSDRGVAFAIEAPPTEPIELRLGPLGSIRATAAFQGQPLRSFRNATLTMVESEEGRRHWTPDFDRFVKVGPDGAAVWHHVPLGQEFRVSSPDAGLGMQVTGPRTAGQLVEVVLSPETRAVLLRGRALDPERQPLADAPLQAVARGPSMRAHAQTRTDAEGRFLVQLTTSENDLRVDSLVLLRNVEDTEPWRIDLLPRTLRAGIEELGDVVLAPGPIVVAGRFTAGGEPFTDALWLRLEREEPASDKRPRPRWRGLDEVQQRQDGDRFTVRGTLPPGRYRLTVHGERQLPLDPIEFRLGQTDLEVRIDTGARLAASVLLPPNSPSDSLRVELISAVADPKTGTSRRHTTSPQGDQDDRHQLRWNAVPPGTYALVLQLTTATAPLVHIDAVVVPPPAGGDPRLIDIDLRPLVRVVMAQVVTPDGKPADDADGVIFPTGLSPDSEWPAHRFWTMRWRMLLPAAPTTLLVGVLNHRPQLVTASGDRLVIPAEPWPQVSATLADLPPELAKARFQARLVPTEELVGTCQHQWGSEKRADWLQPREETRGVANGSFALPIADGPHRLKLWLRTGEGQHEIEVAGPVTVLPNAGQITVSVTAEEWAKAKAKFQAASKPKK